MKDSSSTGDYTYTQLGGGTNFQARGPHEQRRLDSPVGAALVAAPVATRSA